MRTVLVPTTRMPRALALIRAFGEAGDRVVTCDTEEHHREPASHSRYVSAFTATPAPATDPSGYATAVARIVHEHDVDLIVPQFEEILYLAQVADLLGAPMLASPFATLVELHDKARFERLAAGLGLPVPRTIVARDRAGLAAAVEEIGEFVARPAYSRGGLVYLTNVGPRAGERAITECAPSDENPWLVQEFVEGDDVCTLSVAREGRVVLHCSYRPTVQMRTGASIQFTSEDDFGGLAHARAIAGATGLTGVFGLDMRIDADGRPVLLECNPRCTNGLFLVPREWIVDAITGPAEELRVVPAGRRRQWDVELLMPKLSNQPAGKAARELFAGSDPTFARGDLEPALVMLGNLLHYTMSMLHGGHDLISAFEEEVVWDGQVVDRAALASAGG